MRSRVILVLLFSVLVVFPAFSEEARASVAVEEKPVFIGLGFGFGGEDPYVPVELRIFDMTQTNLSQGKGQTTAFRSILIFKDEKFPVKIIKPDLNAFRADVMDMKPSKPGSPAIPIGHITFKVEKPDSKHAVAVGTVLLRSQESGVSGTFKLYLHMLAGSPPSDEKSGADAKSGGNGD